VRQKTLFRTKVAENMKTFGGEEEANRDGEGESSRIGGHKITEITLLTGRKKGKHLPRKGVLQWWGKKGETEIFTFASRQLGGKTCLSKTLSVIDSSNWKKGKQNRRLL